MLVSAGAFTAVLSDGTAGAGAKHCQNWTSASPFAYTDVGVATFTTEDWTDSGAPRCDCGGRLECSQQA